MSGYDKNIRFVSLSSGSSGNCFLISYNGTNILIDVGIPYKKIEECLRNFGLRFDDINAIFLTHSHIDHIRAIKQCAKINKIDIYGLKDTLQYIINTYDITEDYEDLFHIIYGSEVITLDNGFDVEPISSYHDVPSVCYQITVGDINLAIVTDLGCFTKKMLSRFNKLDILVIEANYNDDMLDESTKYPEMLKRRIRGGDGHLSNKECAEFIKEVYSDRLKKVFLAHLSIETNTPSLAQTEVLDNLNLLLDKHNDEIPDINVLDRFEITEIYKGEN